MRELNIDEELNLPEEEDRNLLVLLFMGLVEGERSFVFEEFLDKVGLEAEKLTGSSSPTWAKTHLSFSSSVLEVNLFTPFWSVRNDGLHTAEKDNLRLNFAPAPFGADDCFSPLEVKSPFDFLLIKDPLRSLATNIREVRKGTYTILSHAPDLHWDVRVCLLQ